MDDRLAARAVDHNWCGSAATTSLYTRTFRRKQLNEMVPLADSAIFEIERRGEFPRRYALSPRTVVWNLDEVESQLTERRTKPILGT